MTNIQWHAQKNTKAFDNLRHDEINKQLTQLKVDGKTRRKKHMCLEQTAAVCVDGGI